MFAPRARNNSIYSAVSMQQQFYFYSTERGTFLFRFTQQFYVAFRAVQDFPLLSTHERSSTTCFIRFTFAPRAQQFYSAQYNNNSIFDFCLFRLLHSTTLFYFLSSKNSAIQLQFYFRFGACLDSLQRATTSTLLIFRCLSASSIAQWKRAGLFLVISRFNHCDFSDNMLTSVCPVLVTCEVQCEFMSFRRWHSCGISFTRLALSTNLECDKSSCSIFFPKHWSSILTMEACWTFILLSTTTLLAQCRRGSLKQFTCDSFKQFTCGSLKQFTCGSLAQCSSGSLKQWTRGSLNAQAARSNNERAANSKPWAFKSGIFKSPVPLSQAIFLPKSCTIMSGMILKRPPASQSWARHSKPCVSVRQELVDRVVDYRTTMFSLFETMMVFHFKVGWSPRHHLSHPCCYRSLGVISVCLVSTTPMLPCVPLSSHTWLHQCLSIVKGLGQVVKKKNAIKSFAINIRHQTCKVLSPVPGDSKQKSWTGLVRHEQYLTSE